MSNAAPKDKNILVIRANPEVRDAWINMLKELLKPEGYNNYLSAATRADALETIHFEQVSLVVANEDFTSRNSMAEFPQMLKDKNYNDVSVLLIVAPSVKEKFSKAKFEDLYDQLNEFPNVMLIEEPFTSQKVKAAITRLLTGDNAVPKAANIPVAVGQKPEPEPPTL